MADYLTMTEAVDAGLTNMTVLRAHVRNDDSTVAYDAAAAWFVFNSNPVTKIYSSGNSWLGLGAEAENLKVNRRDGAVWDEYSESGRIGSQKFFKFTWKGTSQYNNILEYNSEYQQYYDVFLIEDGRIYLNFYRVPTTAFNGVKALVCGSETITFAVTAGEACEYTFIPSDRSTGTGWRVEQGRPDVTTYLSSGEAIFEISDIHNITSVNWSEIFWTADIPEGTTITLSAKLDDEEEYTVLENGGKLIPVGVSLENSTIYLKVEMSTEDIKFSPSLSYVHINIRDVDNLRTILVKLPLGNPHSIQNAIGEVNFRYDGSGGLIGLGGSVAAFDYPFLPQGLEVKPHQHEIEHIEVVDISGAGINTDIVYTDYSNGEEIIEVADISGSGVRTYIGDL